MSISQQRQKDTAVFTNALKQVFYIHKNIVSELYAKLDVLSDECKLLKADSHNPKSCERCESCVNIEKMNRSQQEHFDNLLHKKTMEMKALGILHEEKLQSLTGESNTENIEKQKNKFLSKKISHFLAKDSESVIEQEHLPKDLDVTHSTDNCKGNIGLPLETCNPREAENVHETELYKCHTRLSLCRQSKRNCHYPEVQQEAKRMRLSSPISEKDKNNSLHKMDTTAHNDTFCIPDTNLSTQMHILQKPPIHCDLSEANKYSKSESVSSHQNQKILVIPETLAFDNSSYPDSDNDMILDNHNDKNNCNQKESVSNHERDFDHSNVNENFIDSFGDRIDENIMHSVKTNNIENCCVQVLNECLHDDSNYCDEDESSYFGKGVSECERNCNSKTTRRLVCPNESKCEVSFRQSNGNKKNEIVEVMQGQVISQNTMDIMDTEENRQVNEINLEVEGSLHKNDIKNTKINGSISVNCFDDQGVKQESQISRKTNIASVRNKFYQARQGDTHSNTKDGHTGQVRSTDKSVDNLPCQKQATVHQGAQSSKTKNENNAQFFNFSDLEEEKLKMAKAIQRSLKSTENKSPRKPNSLKINSEFQVINCSAELNFVKSKQMSNTRKDIVFKEHADSLLVSQLLPVTSPAPSEMKSLGYEETIRMHDTSLHDCKKQILNIIDHKLKDVQISGLSSSELNGSLNPDIHLSEFLNSETVTERHQTLSNFDETIAPSLISQNVLSQQKQNISLLARLNSEKSKTSEKMEALKKHNSLNNQLLSPVKAEGTTGKQLQKSCGELLNESKPEVKDEWYDDDDSIFTCMEDDSETIEPSPQLNTQNGSQLHSSIPSISCSFKFIYKKPLLAVKSTLEGAGKPVPEILSNSFRKENLAVDVSKSLLTNNPSFDFGDSTVLDIDRGPPPQSVLDSFDRVPKPEEKAEFPHISVVRKRSEREKLEGFSCKQCYEYYKNSGLSEEEIKQKKNECSRHRERYRPPNTPDHFWSLGFPDTAEMLERRQKCHSKESPVTANRAPRRRRRLEQKF